MEPLEERKRSVEDLRGDFASRAKTDKVWLRVAVCVLAVAFFGVFLLVFWQVLLEVNQPVPSLVLGLPAEVARVTTLFEQYKDRADTLFKLITVLMGMSPLYSIVVGIAGYSAAQFYKERFSTELANAKALNDTELAKLRLQSAEFEKQHPRVREEDHGTREEISKSRTHGSSGKRHRNQACQLSA